MKTDNDLLFNFTLETLDARKDVENLAFTHDLYQSALYETEQQLVTDYEHKFRQEGKRIKYLRFTFTPEQETSL